jgi:hypothetical protein
MEVKSDRGCDSGLFFRTTEDDVADQVTLDYLPTTLITDGLLRWRPGAFWRWRNIGITEL